MLLDLLIVIIAFLVVFSFLVLVHEWGHFFAAIKCGVKVEEFGLGMPPKAKVLAKRKGTEYTLNWIPFGGFVRMLGQSDFDPASDQLAKDDPRSFRNKHYLQKVLIISAGVIMNFLAAFILLMIVMLIGFRPLMVVPDELIGTTIPSYLTPTASYLQANPERFPFEEVTDKNPTFLTAIEEGSLADEYGLEVGDRILSLNGTDLTNESTIEDFLTQNKGSEITFALERINIETGKVTQESITIPTIKDQMIGIGFGQIPQLGKVRFEPWEVPGAAAQELGNQMLITLTLAKKVFGGIFTKGEVSKSVSGPVGIASATGAVAKRGLVALLLLTIILSINLGIMNILPIPALDGGHLLTITVTSLYRKVFKKEPNPNIEATIHGLGFAFLMLLIIMVTWNDIMRLIP